MSAPSWRQGVVLFAAGSLLAASTCYGAVLYDSNDTLSLLFAAGFTGGMALALGGTVLMVIRASSRSAAPAAQTGSTVSRPTWKQALVMLASGAVLGASSCYGFLETIGVKNNHWYGPFATGFYLGCLLALGALVMVAVRLIRIIFAKPVSAPPR
ncbi:MAG TPA: hypothetical protein VLE48_03735 [Terriglobales bacterium]|nr:hypothetical protein [Terriglobales bacterium]